MRIVPFQTKRGREPARGYASDRAGGKSWSSCLCKRNAGTNQPAPTRRF